eukprot:2448171-Amphidinium_carterae.1
MCSRCLLLPLLQFRQPKYASHNMSRGASAACNTSHRQKCLKTDAMGVRAEPTLEDEPAPLDQQS